ncbi:MAG TPA: Ig-like domain-containing protein, partial [Gaiellales bacterium]
SDPLAPVVPVAPVVNHAPSFTRGADQSVREDAGAQTVGAWAGAISPGPAGEAAQAVTFTVTDDDAALFAAGHRPAIAPDGTLTYTPAADASGTATVTVRAADDGGTDGGGSDTSAAQTFQIVVAAVNDAPSFSAGAAQTVNENSGAGSVAGWATAIARGPADEAGQVVHFTVASSDTTLFTVGGQPAVAANGTLTFTPATGANGVATLTVRAVDDGGVANGGVDTSAPQTVLLTIVNRAPTAVADGPGVLENSVAGVTFDVLANDTDPESDALTVASYDDSAIADGAVTHGAGGSFTYVPAAHFAGTDTFSYTASDGNGNTATGTVTITVTAVPDPPTAGDDAYVTAQGVALVQPAPGLLANDTGSGALTVDTTPVAAPANGVLVLGANGSFTYTPALGFTGADTFTYRATDLGTGLSATAVATVTVSATFSTSTLFLTGSGSTSELWDLSTASQPNSLLGLVPDYDGNLLAGLTIKGSNGSDSGDAQRSQTWRYPLPGGLVLDGPVVLHLTSSGNGSNVDYGYLYDCTAGGASCTQIGSGSTTWSGGILGLGWVSNDVGLGTVNRTLAAGHELRVRVYSGSGDQAFAMTGDLPSSLTLTVP